MRAHRSGKILGGAGGEDMLDQRIDIGIGDACEIVGAFAILRY
jgi:hypothetical protein